MLERTGRATVADRYVDTLHRRLDRPAPWVVDGLALRGMVSAAIDISDGLLSDLGHVAKASNVGFRIWLDKLPLSRALEQIQCADCVGVDGPRRDDGDRLLKPQSSRR